MPKSFTNRPAIFLLLCLLLTVGLSSCRTTQKRINEGNYDIAIARTVNKLRKNKNKERQITMLHDAYHKANERDLDRIEFLKREAATGNEVQVFNLYNNIQARQDKIRPLMPLYVEGTEVAFTFYNIERELIAWKEEAAAFLYENAMRQLGTEDKYQAREAFEQLTQLKQLFPYYKDVDQQLDRAYNMGMNWVLFNVVNRSPNLIPIEFEDELYSLDFSRLNGKWFTLVTTRERRAYQYEYDKRVDIVLDIVDVGPELVKEKVYTETKEIQDGFTYEYDANGNVKKDSAGNDIKHPKYKEISATITETAQSKSATFRGRLQVYQEPNDGLLENDPMVVNFLFEHYAATFQGNKNALTKESLERIGNSPVPFPTDFQMVMDGSQEIQPVIFNFIRRYTRLLEG